MLVYALSMDRNLVAIGFRRVVAYARRAGFDVKSIYFLDDCSRASFAGSWWKQSTGDSVTVNQVTNDRAILSLAETLAKADVVAFSLMSVQRNIVKKLSAAIKERNPATRILIGGYHPTIFPDDAITFADLICLGEGERTFTEFLHRVRRNESLVGLSNTWLRERGEVIKNPRMPLMTPSEMEQAPFMEYGLEDQFLFSYRHGLLRQMDQADLVRHLGTTYNTIWSVGCPHKCSFCSQETFIRLDRDYASYRGPSPAYIISEIEAARSRFPVDYVIFYDSNFLGRSIDDLRDFSARFRTTGLKLVLSGTNPASITEEKIGVLMDAGLTRIKMGFESANDEVLRLFKRPASAEQLRRATEVLARFGNKMVAPAFEMIVDNPYESTEQLYDTVDFLEKTPPPFTINLFSLQFMPGTSLSSQTTDYSLVEEQMEKEYMFSYRPSAINNLISLFAILKPSTSVMKALRRLIRGREESTYPRIKGVLYKLMLMRRALNQARFGDFSTFPWWMMVLYHRYRLLKTRIAGAKYVS